MCMYVYVNCKSDMPVNLIRSWFSDKVDQTTSPNPRTILARKEHSINLNKCLKSVIQMC